MPRKDIHRPSAIVPSEYEFVAHDYIGPASDDINFLRANRAYFRSHMARTGGKFSGHEHGGTCHVCGATALYIAKFYHPSTNSYIVTGEDCSEKMELGDAHAFRVFRDKVVAGREAAAGKNKAKRILSDAGLLAAWELREAAEEKRAAFAAASNAWRKEHPEPVLVSDASGYGCIEVGAPVWVDFTKDEYTALDIVGKLVKYGSVSDKALNFLGALVKRIAEAPALAAKRATEAEAAAPVPVKEGRWLVEGEVLTVKSQEGRFGLQIKMLVKHADGFKLWGTVPAALAGIERGKRVSFVAAVERSDKDKSFGFFSRPAQAKIKEAA